MSDPIEPETPEPPVLDYVVVAIDEAAGTAEVRFLNPDHAGGPPSIETRPIPNPAAGEEGEPDWIEEDHEVDRDPNGHVVKSVRVPLGIDGHIDQAAWQSRLVDQARGVKARMDQAKAPTPAPGAFAGLMTETSSA